MIQKYSQLKTAILHEDGFISPEGKFFSAGYEAHNTLARNLIKELGYEKEWMQLYSEQQKKPYIEQDKRMSPIAFLIDKGWVRIRGTMISYVPPNNPYLAVEFSSDIDWVKSQVKKIVPNFFGTVVAEKRDYNKNTLVSFTGNMEGFLRWGGTRDVND